MRGEYCVAGASILSALSVILLIFVNIGQISTGAVVNSLYLIQIDTSQYGASFAALTNSSAGNLYDTNNDKLGTAYGMRLQYKWGIYNVCGYQKDGSGVCNSTIFGYPYLGLDSLQTDIPPSFRQTTHDLVTDQQPFSNTSYNNGLSRAGSLFIFFGSVLALFACGFGAIKSRLFFLIATCCSAASATCLMVGAAMWTGLIRQNAQINTWMIGGGKYPMGFYVYAGPALWLTWVAFVFMLFATIPYVISWMTYRRM